MTKEEAETVIKEYLYNHRFGYIAKDAEFDRLYEAMKVAVQALEQEPKWIPVSERLPEINEWVVCQCRANIYEVLKFTSYGWYHDDAHCYMDGFVIAWMPLPKPYKGEQE